MAKNHPNTVEEAQEATLQSIEDAQLLERLENAILKSAKGFERFRREVPLLLRKAIDEVIDPARTNRFTLAEIEKTEKTYLGTKVEILLRNFLRLPKGEILDVLIEGVEVDIKNTMHQTWMIPSEAMGHPCILVKTDEESARFSIGLALIRDAILTKSKNKDGKSSISRAGKGSIRWMLRDEAYPENFWQNMDPEIRKKITGYRSGTKRVDALFRLIQNRPISRLQVLAVAQQKDAMKRLRKNGGARDSLARDGVALLSGYYDRELIKQLHLPNCGVDEFISYTPITQEVRCLLRDRGHIK